ncbi:MAG: sigma-70 family RNA polymerase sigma factor [Pseudomonadota bacterium]
MRRDRGLAVMLRKRVGDQRNRKPDDATDDRLIGEIACGDVQAFERLYRGYFKRLIGFALRMTDRTDLAEEIASDTLMAVWRGAKSFESRSRPSTWIFGIAYRITTKALDRSSRHQDVSDNEITEDLAGSVSGIRQLENLFIKDQLARAMRGLSAEHRASIELTYYYGYSCSEIAEIMDCPIGTVKTRMMHARAKLKQLLTANPTTPQEGRHG